MAHDMKSPLVSIQGFARRLLERPEEMPPEKRSRYLQIIQKEAGKLEELILDFLDFSRLQSGHLKLSFVPTDLTAELSDLVDTFMPRFDQAGTDTANETRPMTCR